MSNLGQHRIWISLISHRAAVVGVGLAMMFVLTVVGTQSAQAQTFTVIHTFTGGQDGATPFAGVTMDRAGNLYGASYEGGKGFGTVYKLTHKGSSWSFNPLYSFAGGADGANPWGRVAIGPDGSLYGTTLFGGRCDEECGTVFNLKPQPSRPRSVLDPWNKTLVYSFNGGSDGGLPYAGDLVFDSAGNLYGTASIGGTGGGCLHGCGVVYEMTPSGNSWVQTVVHNFGATSGDGLYPKSGLIPDTSGNLYGTTTEGGDQNGDGAVYQLTYTGSSWAEEVLYSFSGGDDGSIVFAGLASDQSGNLYGAATGNGSGNSGTVFMLSPSKNGWNFGVIYSFIGNPGEEGGPWASLIIDSGGNLYGTAKYDGAYGLGSVFKLTPSGGGSWTYSSLHDFTGGADGEVPTSTLAIDANNNLYGTASTGGASSCGCGVVFEITQ